MSFFDKLKAGLEKTRRNFTDKLENIIAGHAQIDDELLEDIEMLLIMADVGITTTDKLMTAIKVAIREREINSPDQLRPYLQEKISAILSSTPSGTKLSPQAPTVILVVGVNGVGKTTTIAKLGYHYREEGKKVIFAAADTFRAAAIEQLEVWGDRVGADVVKHDLGADPAAVTYDALQSAKAKKADILFVDTAGRLHTKSNLMAELKKINRIIGREIPDAPHETLLVLDATTGQNALNQAKVFSEACQVSGLVLTKLDGTAKGGIIIAISSELNLPVKWIGVGEGLNDLKPFNPEEFSRALFPDK